MKNIIYLLSFIIVSCIGCSGTVKSDVKKDGDNTIHIKRFDKQIYNYLSQPTTEKEQYLRNEYPALLPAFGRIAMDNTDPANFFPSLKEYFAHPALMQIYKDALSTFENIELYEEKLSEAEAMITHYMNGRKLPQLAMHVSGFKENVIVVNDMISISIDKYLGSNYPAYHDFFKPYELQQMQPDNIVRDYLKAWLMSDIVKQSMEDQTLLSAIVNEGKILYALSLLLPESEPNNLIGYTQEQVKWSMSNEKNIWQKIVKQNYLFSKDQIEINRFVNDAPYTQPISIDSPGRTGSWIGWEIVKRYAEKKGASLMEVINADAQTILKDSKYNP